MAVGQDLTMFLSMILRALYVSTKIGYILILIIKSGLYGEIQWDNEKN